VESEESGGGGIQDNRHTVRQIYLYNDSHEVLKTGNDNTISGAKTRNKAKESKNKTSRHPTIAVSHQNRVAQPAPLKQTNNKKKR
jgi:hypothetical protein